MEHSVFEITIPLSSYIHIYILKKCILMSSLYHEIIKKNKSLGTMIKPIFFFVITQNTSLMPFPKTYFRIPPLYF